MESALTFLQGYNDDGDEFLDRIITGDETWIAHTTPETKQQSTHWHHSGSPCVGAESDVHGIMGQTGRSPRRLPDQG
ncbi:hypothetical protein B7P43_G18184 [Cryptotermes secundus]|uniref:Uncharacterized protein n=1 Tax=Cryptotermes secundus TaxID=105785 RepID=A0A2J7PGH3_9NEOP|nr:hypothetical protein B7P43_G18184 [Cryptotermes secundus]